VKPEEINRMENDEVYKLSRSNGELARTKIIWNTSVLYKNLTNLNGGNKI